MCAGFDFPFWGKVIPVGGDAFIAPWGMSPERSEKTDTPIPSASGPMWASAPTRLIIPDREKCAGQSEADEADFFRGRNYPFISVFWASSVSAAVRGRRTL